jgi:hypothetical protein
MASLETIRGRYFEKHERPEKLAYPSSPFRRFFAVLI